MQQSCYDLHSFHDTSWWHLRQFSPTEPPADALGADRILCTAAAVPLLVTVPVTVAMAAAVTVAVVVRERTLTSGCVRSVAVWP